MPILFFKKVQNFGLPFSVDSVTWHMPQIQGSETRYLRARDGTLAFLWIGDVYIWPKFFQLSVDNI